MKKIIFFVIICMTSLGVASCSENYNPKDAHANFVRGEDGAVGTFSYNGYVYDMGSGGLRKDPDEFVNITETKVKTKEKAIELAKNELIEEEYNQIDVYYDKSTRMWAIRFYLDYVIAGGGQTIFIDSKGITKLVTYGE